MKIKQRQLEWLRERRLIRDICAGVCTEDWMLCTLYLHPHCDEIARVKVEYMRTATGQALLTKLHICAEANRSPLLQTTPPGSVARLAAVQAATFPKLEDLDGIYRAQAQEPPERAQEVQSIREHIARLRKIPRSNTPGSKVASDIVRKWCKDRHIALHPNRKLSTEELERAFDQKKQQLKQQLLLVRQEIEQLNRLKEPLLKAARDQESCIDDLLEELQLRPDRHIDVGKARHAFRPISDLSLRERLLGRVREG